jgi:hypothetical protein
LMAKARKASVGDNLFLPGMSRGVHRQYNHDLFTSMLAGFQTGGIRGVYAGFGPSIEVARGQRYSASHLGGKYYEEVHRSKNRLLTLLNIILPAQFASADVVQYHER